MQEDEHAPKSSEKKKLPDMWGYLQFLFDKGIRKEKIDIIPIKEYNLAASGKHYFVIDDIRKRTIKCTTCPVTHGGVLEAHLLTHYKVEDGVLYFEDKAINQRAELTVKE